MTRENNATSWRSIVVVASAFALVASAYGSPTLANSKNKRIDISGVAEFDFEDDCEASEEGADFALIFPDQGEGSFEGCLYIFVANATCEPQNGGVSKYTERGVESMDGLLHTEDGPRDVKFTTQYVVDAIVTNCDDPDGPLATEVGGGCLHVIIGEEGINAGEFNIIDDVNAFNFPYFGHAFLTGPAAP